MHTNTDTAEKRWRIDTATPRRTHITPDRALRAR